MKFNLTKLLKKLLNIKRSSALKQQGFPLKSLKRSAPMTKAQIEAKYKSGRFAEMSLYHAGLSDSPD